MSEEPPEVSIEAVRPLAMEPMEFWSLIDYASGGSNLSLLVKAVEKLSWKKLLAYDIRMRLVLLEGLCQIRGVPMPTEQDIRECTPGLVSVLLQGESAWKQLSQHQLDRIRRAQKSDDLDTFFTHVETVYINKFYFGTGALKTNPAALGNGILNYRLLTRIDPWDEIRG